MHMHGISNSSATFSPNVASLRPLIQEILSKVHQSSKNSIIYWLHCTLGTIRHKVTMATLTPVHTHHSIAYNYEVTQQPYQDKSVSMPVAGGGGGGGEGVGSPPLKLMIVITPTT